jgi:hypothetical protein
MAELDAALPFIPRDLHRLTAEYARMIGADLDLDTCLVAGPAAKGQKHSYFKPDTPQPSTAALRWTATPATIVTIHMAAFSRSTQKFLRIVGRETFRQSGLRRFAIRFEADTRWSLGIGVTAHTPEEAVRTTQIGGAVCKASDGKTALCQVCGRGWYLSGAYLDAASAAVAHRTGRVWRSGVSQ